MGRASPTPKNRGVGVREGGPPESLINTELEEVKRGQAVGAGERAPIGGVKNVSSTKATKTQVVEVFNQRP